jgi:hypothetical protein
VSENINPSLASLATPIDRLRPDPKNARRHDDRSVDSIAASFRTYGQQKPIVILKDGTVIAGNGSLAAAKKLGWKKLAAVRFDDEVQARAYALADNRTAELSSWDDLQLGKTLDELSQAPGFDPELVGFTDAEMMKLIAAASADTEMIDNTPLNAEKPRVGEPGTTEAPPSHVRMVQLFFDETTQSRFMEAVKALAKQYETSTVTDTVLRAVEDLAAKATFIAA